MGAWSYRPCYESLNIHLLSVVTFLTLTEQLLDHETRASDQVPLLLKMKEDRLALNKAVNSGDTDMGGFFFWSVLPLADVDTSLLRIA